MGMFSDDIGFADSKGGAETFAGLTGQELPYGSTNYRHGLFFCKEPQENNNDGNEQ
jgi:hypothetical protein